MSKILIIEDDEIVANIYRNKLRVEGFEVESAGDGEAGLGKARQFRPDAILLDLMLPKVTGIELMRQLRAEPDFARTPFIVFSNTYLTNIVQEAWKAGATKCLSKANCTPKHVIEALRASLSAAAGNGAAPAAPASAPAPQTAPASDEALEAELRRELLAGLPATVVGLRTAHQQLVKTSDPAAQSQSLMAMYRPVHALTGNAGLAGLKVLANFTDAFEALLKELAEKPAHLNPSTLRTVASGIDFLHLLSTKGGGDTASDPGAAHILVVDDEAISRRAVNHALEKARLKAVNADQPLTALQLLRERRYELIFLDVDMPEMTGYELCAKLRELPAYQHTPVVFVTALNDLAARANSTMSGGNDFIAKPFLFIELAVKALLHLHRARLAAAK